MVTKTGNFRMWTTFWSTITPDGTRYRHQVRQKHESKQWHVRTQILGADDRVPYYTVPVPVPPGHGMSMFKRRASWTNVDEEGRPMYPPEYPHGFLNLEDPPQCVSLT